MPAYKDTQRGTWYVKFQVTDPLTGKRRAVLRRGFATKREALDYEAKHRTEGAETRHTAFCVVFEEWLKSLEASEETKAQKRNWLQRYFPLFDADMKKLTRPALQKWRNDLAGQGLAPRTMNRGIGYVRSVCDYAEKLYGVPSNSMVLTRYKEQKTENALHVWTIEEFNRFIEKVNGEYYKAYFTFLFWTGCRRSEALAVCRDDITGNKARIWHAMKHYKNGFIPLKTESSKRTITLDPRTLEVLKPCIDRASPFVFGGDRPLSITQLQVRFTKAVKASGVPPIRIHDLRHSHATILINNGVNIVAVSKRLGHSSISMTLEIYTHLLQKTDDEMMQTIENLNNSYQNRITE